MEHLADGVVRLKKELAGTYSGNAHLYEAVPSETSDMLPIGAEDLAILHNFARNNPIYTGSSRAEVGGTRCIIYEGDINNHWLDSIKHDTSYAPFYPTWILSAYVLARKAVELGVRESVDIGSGDGRIAYCCGALGIRSHAIEIDGGLVGLQRGIADATGASFDAAEADATRYDYSSLNLQNAAFFIGGLPQVGEILAGSVINSVTSVPGLGGSVFIMAGAGAPEMHGTAHGGWGHLIRKMNLDVIATLTLPTRWTIDQPADTPYVFARGATRP